jgi:lipopolysaccharide export system permease protein
MKKMLFRKFLLDYMKFFLIAIFSASIVIWVFQAVNYLDIMIEDGRDYKVYINYSLLNFPKIINKLYPFVLFFSLFHIIIKYENNNELIIFWTFGISKLELINFIFKFSIVLMLVQIILSSLIVPKSRDVAKSFLKNSKVNFFGNFVKPQKFNDTIKNVTIYSEKKDEQGNLYNLYLKKQTNLNDFEITYAKRGVFKESGNIPILILFDGATINSKNNKITNISFSKSDFPLNNFETNTALYKKVQELTSLNLIRCVNSIYSKTDKVSSNIVNCSKNLKNIYRELYKRFIIPFYIPLLILVPLLLTISSKENLNYNRFKVATFFLGLFFIIFSETTIKIISETILKNFFITSIPFLLILILYLVFFSKNNFKLSSK